MRRIEGQVSTINKKNKGTRIKGKRIKEQGKRLEEKDLRERNNGILE